MHPIFAITKSDIQSLDDVQARELVARLCKATVSKLGIAETAVTWSGNQRAGDGGVDVRVDCADQRLCDTAIKKNQSVLQVKAEVFEPAKIAPEMAPKGIIRPAILELAGSQGAYIIASTKDDVSDKVLKKRRAAMNACLDTHGLMGKVEVDFYDSRRIADWVEQHPALVIWVLHALGRKLTGWKPYGPWAYSETSVAAEYLIDKRAKLFAPHSDEGRDSLAAINDLRKAVNATQPVRLVGLSGVGKTRLVQALFDVRIETAEPALNPGNVIYTDVSDQPDPQVESMLSTLCSGPHDVVVVIDNCSQQTHSKLVEILSNQVGSIRLLTVEYDIRDDVPVGTSCFRLEGSSSETIGEFLKIKFPILSHNDIATLVRVSDGNARLAFVLASTANVSGEIAVLRDEVLFERLFLQKKMQSDELLRCGKVASLVYSFDVDDGSAQSELKVLADLAEMSVKAFRRNVVELERRGLIQSRGKWRALLPHAVSNRLAANGLAEIPRDELLASFGYDAIPRLGSSFARRLSFLHESSEAIRIVNEWLAPTGRLGDLKSLTIQQAQVFELIAPVSPEGTLAAIERFASGLAAIIQGALTIDRFSALARLIAYDEQLFDRCVEVLLTFSKIKDTHGSGRPSVDELLRSLFFASLSGTHATPRQRAKVVRRLVFSTSTRDVQIGLSLLDASLTTHHFSSFLMFEFGLRRRNYGWRPRSQSDIKQWYSLFVAIAGELGAENSDTGHRAREILGKKVRGLWVHASMDEEILALAPALQAIDGWAEGWIAVKRILRWDVLEESSEARQKVIKFEQLLKPRNLKESVIAKVVTRSIVDGLDDGRPGLSTQERLQNAHDEAVTLGRAMAAEEPILLELLPRIVSLHSRGNVVPLGMGVGQCINETPHLLPAIRQLLVSTQEGISARFLEGVMSGWNEMDPAAVSLFLDDAVEDPVWGKIFPELQSCTKLDARAVDRLLASLKLGLAPIRHYEILGSGRVTSTLNVDEVSRLINAIRVVPSHGQHVAMNVLNMIVFGASDHNTDYRRLLGKYCIMFIKSVDWATANEDVGSAGDDSESIIKMAVDASDSMKELVVAFKRILNYRTGKPSWYRSPRGNLIKPFLERYPIAVLNLVCVTDKDGSYETALRMLSNERSGESTILGVVPDDALLTWCAVSEHDRFAFAIQACSIVSDRAPEGLAEPEQSSLSSTVHTILNNAPSKAKMVELLADRLQRDVSGGALQGHLSLLEAIDSNGDEEVVTELTKARTNFAKSIEFWKSIESKSERHRAESFE
ncbi:MAG: hypothetical protein ACREPB_10760 [Arenimonas sp.]